MIGTSFDFAIIVKTGIGNEFIYISTKRAGHRMKEVKRWRDHIKASLLLVKPTLFTSRHLLSPFDKLFK